MAYNLYQARGEHPGRSAARTSDRGAVPRGALRSPRERGRAAGTGGDPRAGGRARHHADQGAGAELPARPEHDPPDRADRRPGPGRRRARGRARARLADPRPARRGRAGDRGRGRPGAGRGAAGDGRRPAAGPGRRAHGRGRGRAPAATTCPTRSRPRWSRTCRTTSRCRWCCTCCRCCRRCAPGWSWCRRRSRSGWRPAGLEDVRRAVGEGGLVCGRAAGRLDPARGVLAGAERRLRPGRADPPGPAGRRRPGRPRSPSSTPPSRSAARRCGRRWPAGPARPPRPSGGCARPASIPGCAARPSTSPRTPGSRLSIRTPRPRRHTGRRRDGHVHAAALRRGRGRADPGPAVGRAAGVERADRGAARARRLDRERGAAPGRVRDHGPGPGRRDRGHRRPVRGDQGDPRRLLPGRVRRPGRGAGDRGPDARWRAYGSVEVRPVAAQR